MPHNTERYIHHHGHIAKASAFCYDDEGLPVSSWRVAREVKEKFRQWEALHTKDPTKVPKKPSEREGWVYCPRDKK